MTIYRAICFGVFASICFLSGFITHKWVLVDKSILSDLKEAYSSYYGHASDVMYFRSEINIYETLLEAKRNGDIDQYIDAYRNSIAGKIEYFEENLDQYSTQEREIIFGPAIEDAKRALANSN